MLVAEASHRLVDHKVVGGSSAPDDENPLNDQQTKTGGSG